jgi:hypothetical protein
VIISSHKLDKAHRPNIEIIRDYFNADYCGISNEDDFHNYEDIVTFKYKIINKKKQLSKICDFISDHKLKYDFFVKCRPDVKLLEPIDFDKIDKYAINARARVYYGNRVIKYGNSVGGAGIWKDMCECYYFDNEHLVVLDDMLYIFHKNVVKRGAFNKLVNEKEKQNEWFHTQVFDERNIKLNVIGINLIFTKNDTYSGDINYIKKFMIKSSR